MTKPLVSICCITYNHAPYIAQAIEGFLMQQTNFEVEVVIHDDASTDGTSHIVRQYAQRYPEKIRATVHPVNKGMMPNFIGCLQDCRGEYIALCEGDDYWTEPLKLVNQVKALQQNPQWSGVAHRVNIVNQANEPLPAPNSFSGQEVDLHFLFHHKLGHFIPTCSLLFVARYWRHPIWQEELFFGDFTLHIVLALKGPIGFMHHQWACYRRHTGGISYGMNWQAYLAGYPRFYGIVKKYLPTGKKHYIHRNLFEVYLNGANHYLGKGDLTQGAKLVKEAIKHTGPSNVHKAARLLLKLMYHAAKAVLSKKPVKLPVK